MRGRLARGAGRAGPRALLLASLGQLAVYAQEPCNADQERQRALCTPSASSQSHCSSECDTKAVVRALGTCTITDGVPAADAVSECCDNAQRAALSGDGCDRCAQSCPVVELLGRLGGCIHEGRPAREVLLEVCDSFADCSAGDRLLSNTVSKSRSCWGAIGALHPEPCTYQCAAGYGIESANHELAESLQRPLPPASQGRVMSDGTSWGGLTESLECSGTTWTRPGASSAARRFTNACEQCPAGRYSNGNSVGCVQCRPGQEPSPDQTECRACENGRVSNAETNGRCRACGSGEQPSADGSQCEACAEDEHSDGLHPCEKCARGRRPNADQFACVDIDECERASEHCSPGTTCTNHGADPTDQRGYTCSGCPSASPGSPYISSDPNDPRFCNSTEMRSQGRTCGCADVDECAADYVNPRDDGVTTPRWPGQDVGERACPQNAVCTNLIGGSGSRVRLLPNKTWVLDASSSSPNSTQLGFNCSCWENSTLIDLGDKKEAYYFRSGYDAEQWVASGGRTCADIDECNERLVPTGYSITETRDMHGELIGTPQRHREDGLLAAGPVDPQDICSRLQPEGYYCENGGLPYHCNGETPDRSGECTNDKQPWSHEDFVTQGIPPAGCFDTVHQFDQNTTSGTEDSEGGFSDVVLDEAGNALSQGVDTIDDVAHGGGRVISDLAQYAATTANSMTHAQSNVLQPAPICVNLPGTHVCCMDYKMLVVGSPQLIASRKPLHQWSDAARADPVQGPFYSDTYVYPRECQRINFCNGDTRSPWSTTSTKVHGHQDDWDKVMFEWGFNPEEATANGGCDIHTECVPAAVAEGLYTIPGREPQCNGDVGDCKAGSLASASRSESGSVHASGSRNWDSLDAWYGVNCTRCPEAGEEAGEEDLTFVPEWGPKISSDGVSYPISRKQEEAGPACPREQPDCAGEPGWLRTCHDNTDDEANSNTVTHGIMIFFFVCCCGLIKSNRSVQVELEEARRNELQKLVLENFENHPRKAGYTGDTGLDEDEIMPTLELNAETLTNPVAVADYGFKMARFQMGNLNKLGGTLLSAVVGGAETALDLVDDVVEYVPGQQYVRDALNEGLELVRAPHPQSLAQTLLIVSVRRSRIRPTGLWMPLWSTCRAQRRGARSSTRRSIWCLGGNCCRAFQRPPLCLSFQVRAWFECGAFVCRRDALGGGVRGPLAQSGRR